MVQQIITAPCEVAVMAARTKALKILASIVTMVKVLID